MIIPLPKMTAYKRKPRLKSAFNTIAKIVKGQTTIYNVDSNSGHLSSETRGILSL